MMSDKEKGEWEDYKNACVKYLKALPKKPEDAATATAVRCLRRVKGINECLNEIAWAEGWSVVARLQYEIRVAKSLF